jgi:hypothetical protein
MQPGCSQCQNNADCNDSNPCTNDRCNAGSCVNTPITDGTVCGTSNLCSSAPTCQAGTCTSGAVTSCDDANPCTLDTCDPQFGCRHMPAVDGLACDDRNACTSADACHAGMCRGLVATCNDNNPCTTDSCDPSGGCHHTALADGMTGCSDGNTCNGFEVCVGGLCQPGTPLACDDANPCTNDSCDPIRGCQHSPVLNGTSCSDGNPCNGAETCQFAHCHAGAPLSCSDGDPCTADTCSQATGCQHATAADGTPCSDGNACNGAETCQGGACTTVAGTVPNCDDGNGCTNDACNPTSGCVHPPFGNGTSCSDGNVCNGLETCQSGACSAAAPNLCNDQNACTTDSCDPVAGCRHVAVADGTSCSDGNVCTGTEVCQGGACLPGVPLDCNDSDPCTADTCDGVTGCGHAAVANGTPCPDGDPCNGTETCQGGACAAATPSTCDDNNPCTTDSCVAGVGCQHAPVPNGTTCSDGNVCNGLESCQAGSCGSGTPLACDDGNPCTVDGCNPTSGCQSTPAVDGTSCGDGNPCNGDERCLAAACAAGTPLADGTPCSDGNVCNGAETCSAGACAPGVTLVCDDGNPVSTDVCGPLTGCQHDLPIPGTKLMLTSLKPRLRVATQRAFSVSNPPTNGTAADPVLNGASLRIVTRAGFDHTYPLPALGWKYRGQSGRNLGYVFQSATKHVLVRDGGTKISASLPEAPVSLMQDPGPVTVVLSLGANRYCMSFGGVTSYLPLKSYRGASAPPPAACPPP